MAPELSSNWKKLRLQLASELSTDEQKRKRKLAVPTERQRNGLAKKRRLEGNGDSRAVTSNPAGGIVKKSKKERMDESAELKGPSATLALWAEDHDISPQDLEDAYGHSYGTSTTAIPLTISDSINSGLISSVEIGKYIALDCEMVGVGGSEDRSVLARVSIVNFHGAQIYDSFVRPKEFVTDWRTHVSGISPRHMGTAREFEEVQGVVEGLLRDRVLVGHAVKNDLDALMLGHPKKDIRDTSKFSGFRKISAGRTPSLKNLVREILGVEIQAGEHSSIEDARATMLLFRKHKQAFDVEHAARFPTFAPGSSLRANKKKKKGKH